MMGVNRRPKAPLALPLALPLAPKADPKHRAISVNVRMPILWGVLGVFWVCWVGRNMGGGVV
jgi:hypothetical protein